MFKCRHTHLYRPTIPSVVIAPYPFPCCVRYPVLAIPRSEIVDTVGAGDSFAGGFLARFVTGSATPDCVAAGAYAANYILRRRCCTIDADQKPDIKLELLRRAD